MPRYPDVAIVGGGVIGCSIAFYLARAGARVTLLEREHVGFGASNASAGMVAPLSDANEPGPVQELGLASFHIYDDFVREVEEASGIRVEYARPGVLRVALTEEDETTGRLSVEHARDTGLSLEWLSGEEARRLEPLLSPSVRGASCSHDEPHLSPFRLTEALRRAAISHGAVIREQVPVTGLLTDGTTAKGVRLPAEEVQAGVVVLAAGSWTSMCGDWLGVRLPVFPVRGQVVYVAKLARPLRHCVFRGPTYAVPKGDGMVLLGTTVEKAGFDLRVTAGGMASILGGVAGLVPSVADAAFSHARVGLRPCSADGLPLIGPLPGWQGVLVASGHYRSGILQAPVTARMVTDLIAGGPTRVSPEPFDPSRLEKGRSGQ